MNKIIFDDLKLGDAAKELGISRRELDSKIVDTLKNNKNKDKLHRYYDKTRGPREKKENK